MSFSRWRAAKEAPTDLNLIPVMNLFMVLIPFLLMGAAFYRIGVIPTALPIDDPEQSDIAQTPTTVVVTLSLEPERALATIASVSLSPEQLEGLGKQWKKSAREAYPVTAIQQHLVGLKRTYPRSNTITILPHDDLKYEELVAVLDKVREVDTGKLDREGAPLHDELFPVTIFSRMLVLEEEEPGPREGEGGLLEAAGASEGGEP